MKCLLNIKITILILDFAIIGAQKSGTTTLSKLLASHPDVSFCKEKEPNFWCATSDWRKDIGLYHSKFDQFEGALYGEASTSYSMLPFGDLRKDRSETVVSSRGVFSVSKTPYLLKNTNVYDLLHEYNPELKIIYIVRNPFDRIESAYHHYYQRWYINQGINAALVKDRSLIDLTRYWTQISPYIERFGEKQVVIINFDEIKNDQAAVKEKIFKFLGLPNKKFEEDRVMDGHVHSNSRDYIRLPYFFDSLPGLVRFQLKKIMGNRKSKYDELSPASRQLIRDMLRIEIASLANYMGRDLSSWLD